MSGKEWGQPQLISGSLEFLQYADSQGVKIFYILDRSQKYRLSTMKALQNLGFPQLKQKQILLYGTSKEPCRQSVTQQHEIVLGLKTMLT